MKTTIVYIFSACLVTWVGLVAGTAVAGTGDDGVGACVFGIGFDAVDVFDGTPADGAAYAGVNVAFPVPVNQGPIPVVAPDPVGPVVTLFPNGFVLGASQTGVYDNPTDFETQCCAESGAPADCFAPIA